MTTTTRWTGVDALALMGATAAVADARPLREEMTAARDRAFAEADADGSGTLSAEEFAAFHEILRRGFGAARFARIDADGDGQVSAAELENARPRRHGCGGPDSH